MSTLSKRFRKLFLSTYAQSMRTDKTLFDDSGAAREKPDHATLRVLILTSEAPPVVSGISRTVGALQEGLSAQGHIVDVVSRADFPRVMRNEIRLSTFMFFWPRFRHHLRHYDVVNLHGPVPTVSEIFLILAMMLRSHNRPAIAYTHHCDVAIPKLERFCSIYNWIAGRLAHTADAVIVSSKDYQHKLQSAGSGDVQVIPWAVTPVASYMTRPQRVAGELSVLYVGQLREYKGVRVLLDAVAEIEGTKVSIVGDGPLRDEVLGRAAMPGYEHVTVRGRLSDEELADAYMLHDVVVLPSTTTAEAYGLVLAEGMTAGCVPVASDLPGVREVAAESGVLVRPNDPVELRSAFAELRDDHDTLERLAHSSKLRANSFTTAAMCDRYAETFRLAIASARAKQSTHAVPDLFDEPDHLFEELGEVLGIGDFSLSLLPHNRSQHHLAHVWKYDRHSIKSHAPVAKYVALRNRPVLISTQHSVARDLRPLLKRPELTSSILVPVRRSRSGVSVLGISTNVKHRAVLTEDHLAAVLDMVRRNRRSDSDEGLTALRAS